MSFRTRLTSFFILIVVIPLAAIGVLTFRLIGDSQQGKADARANGLVSVAVSLYHSQSLTARGDARTLARALAASPGSLTRAKISGIASQLGLARVRVSRGSKLVADVGSSEALAPGSAIAPLGAGQPPLTVRVSELTATQFPQRGASLTSGAPDQREGR